MSLVHFGAAPQDAARALLLAAGLREGPRDHAMTASTRAEPFWARYGICGAGLCVANDGAVAPAVFVDAPECEDSLVAVEAREFPRVFDALGAVFPSNERAWLAGNLKVVRVTPCALQAQSADPVVVNGMTGSLGTRVRWNGHAGYLTAGHVGRRAGFAVTDAAGVPIGQVAVAHDPPRRPTADIDVALIACHPGSTVRSGHVPNVPASAVANDAVTVHAPRGLLHTSVRAYCGWFQATKSSVTFADVYLSAKGVTHKGDSGSAVALAGQGVIGHVVAGGPNTSCFQDIASQLARLRMDPAYAALALF